MDANPILKILHSTLSIDQKTRLEAEKQLTLLGQNSKFPVSLTQIALHPQIEVPIRQLAAIILKGHVKKFWMEKNSQTGEPLITDEDKEIIRGNLPKGLSDSSTKIITAVSMVMAEIAHFDFPERWPNLLSGLVSLLQNSQPNDPQTYGAVRCLGLVAEHFSDSQLTIVFPTLYPMMLKMITNMNYPERVREKAMGVIWWLLYLLGMIKAEDENLCDKLFKPFLKDTLQITLNIIYQPTTNVSSCGLKLQAMKIIVNLVSYFVSYLDPYVQSILSSALQSLSQEYQTYYKNYIIENNEEATYDEEGESVSFKAMITELLVLVLTLIGHPKFYSESKKHLQPILYLAVGYSQMTNEQIDEFDNDPNKFIASQDTDMEFSIDVRGAAQEMVTEICEVYEDEAMEPIFNVFKKRLQESAQLFNEKNEHWWKLREAALFFMGSISMDIDMDEFDVEGLLKSVLSNDLAPQSPVYLKGTSLWLLSKFIGSMSENTEFCNAFFKTATFHLQSNQPLPIKMNACRSICRAFEHTKPEIVQPFIPTIFNSTVDLIKHTTEDTAHIILESLAIMFKHSPNLERNDVYMLLLMTLQKYSDDVLIRNDVMHVFQMIVNHSKNLTPLKQQVLPQIINAISNPNSDINILQSSVDLLAIICDAFKEDPQVLLNTSFIPLMNLLMNTTDDEVLQNGTACLQSMIHVAYQIIPNHKINDTNALNVILQFIAKLLHPSASDSCGLYVGELVSELIRKLSNNLGNTLSDIFKMMLTRLSNSQSQPFSQSIIMVFAQMINHNFNSILDYLSNVKIGEESGLSLIARKWSDTQMTIFSKYYLNVSCMALVKLLKSGDNRININVPLDILVKSDDKILTRKQSKKETKMIPFPIRIFIILLDTYIQLEEEKSDEFGLYGGDKFDGLDFLDFDDDEEDDIDPKYSKEDPLYHIHLDVELKNAIKEIAMREQQLTKIILQISSKKQKKYLEKILK